MTEPQEGAAAAARDPAEEVTEEYDGPARLVVDDREIAVHARLSGHFEPIAGRYQWAGRLRAGDDTRAALQPNLDVRLYTEDGYAADATLREEDPWGGFRITGSGRPPFAVPTEIA
ncbi:MAG TPA: DUF4873 domain-containing protein [Nocardioidaceae bacterium]|nr:DUF4873 domain-containing protein [Nocardioidaceae bacterium]